MRLDQLYLSRPFSSWKSVNKADHFPVLPRTPVDGLYICGSSLHPGGGKFASHEEIIFRTSLFLDFVGVMGVPGRLAAEQVIASRN